MIKIIKLILALSLLLPALAYAQGTYILTGTVSDSENGDVLPGATIMIKGTYLGAYTDPFGNFRIIDVKPGTYTIEVSLIGYKMIQRTAFEVGPETDLTLDFKLESTALALGQDVIVIGERPLLDIESTESASIISSKEIEASIVENATDLLRNTPSVVAEKDEIHIRGGRSYENSYLLDGMSIQDPFSGGTSGLLLSANSIEEMEVLTGGFNAEYGQSMSGVVKVKTKKGSQKYKGQFTYKTDNFGAWESMSFNSDIAEASLSGPIPFTKNVASFFASGYGMVSDTYLPNSENLYSSIFGGSDYALRGANKFSGLFKLHFGFSPTRKLTLTHSGSAAIDQGFSANEFENPNPEYNSYPYQYQTNLDNYNTQTRISNQSSIAWSHTTSPSFFYDLRLSRFFTQLRSDVGGKHWLDYTEPVDIVPINYFYVPNWSPIPWINTSQYIVTTGDGFYDYGNGDTWHDHYFDQYTLKFDATKSIGTAHMIKTGFEENIQEMQMVDIVKPWSGKTGLGLNHDIYKVYPSTGAYYFQDKITSFGLIINAGLRMDWWFPGKYVDRAVEDSLVVSPQLRESYYNDTFKLFGQRGKGHLSPRLGVSHPILDNAMLFYSYGHFSKLPKPQRVYAKLNSVSQSTYQLFGNPNLNPETTVSYEIGMRYEVTTDDILTVTAYYRDIFDYISALRITQSGRTGSNSYLMYFNLDYSRSRGIEVEYKKRASNFLTANLATSYTIATGKSSSPKDELLVARGQLEEKSIKENFLSWDRPLRFSADINVFAGKNTKHNLFGITLPSDWDIYLRYFIQSGRRYTTYTKIEIEGEQTQYVADNKEPYKGLADVWQWADLSFKKHFRIKNDFKITFFTEISNIFNTKNSDIINPLTGRAYEYGDQVLDSWNDPLNPDPAPTSPFPFNPARYLEPRNLKIGLSFSW
jgi:outer membrane receptor protein involved in Fe transport